MSEIVARGYDELAGRYAAWRAPGEGGDPTVRYLEALAGLVRAGATVLELVSDELVTIVESEPEPGEATFQWILARR